MATRRGGYKGFGSTTNRRNKTRAVRSLYTALGGTNRGRKRRKNPTTGNLVKFLWE